MTRRRFIADRWTETTAELLGAHAAHVARVLRAREGQAFDLVVGDRVRRARIVEATTDRVRFELLEEVVARDALDVCLLLSIFKFDRLEWALEKVTELGAARVTPVIAARTEKHLAAAAAKRVERWRRIVREAAEQSRRSQEPTVDEPVPLQSVLAELVEGRRIVLAESERTVLLRDAVGGERESGGDPVVLAVGPEGGWTDAEVARFQSSGWTAASLGPTILRAETAAIAAVAIVAAQRL